MATVAAYIDNLCIAGRSLQNSVYMMPPVQHILGAQWGLTVKPTSLKCMAPRGSAEAVAWTDAEVPAVSQIECLGHVLSDDGSSRPCWKATLGKAWKAFWATAGARQCRRRTARESVAQVDRACRPIVEHRSTRWPATRQTHKEACSLGLSGRPGEEPKDFVRRRGRAAAKLVGLEAAWHRRHAQRLLDCREHLSRVVGSQVCAFSRIGMAAAT